MIVNVPTAGAQTLYASIGERIGYLYVAGLVALAGLVIFQHRAAKLPAAGRPV